MNIQTQKIDEFSASLSESSFYDCNCVVCGTQDFEVLATKDRYGFDYLPGICKQCGNIQQTRYYTEAVLTDFYTNFYSLIYRDGSSLDETFKKQQRKGREILRFCNPVLAPGADVLDIGCSCGGVLSIFAQEGHSCVGTDYDLSYLNFGREKGLNLHEGGISNLPQGKTFDLIILRHVLEHIPDPIAFLKQVGQLLKKTGSLYIEVPSIEYVADGGYGFDYSHYFQNAHFIHFTTRSLPHVAALSGLRVSKSDRYIRSIMSHGPRARKEDLDHTGGVNYARSQIELGKRRRDGVYRPFFNFKVRFKRSIKKLITRAN